jgi:hypothetical protein
MFDSDGKTLLDEAYVAGLYLPGSGTLLATAAFRTGQNIPAGFFNGGNVVVPGVPAGSTATVQVRFWRAADGSFEAAAASPTGKIGVSNRFTVLLAGGSLPFPGGLILDGNAGVMTGLVGSSIMPNLSLTHGIAYSFTDPDLNVPSSYQPARFCSTDLGATKWYRLFWTEDTGKFSVYINTFGSQFDTVATVTRGSPIFLDQSVVVACNDNDLNRVDLSKTYSAFTFTRAAEETYFLAISAKKDQPTTAAINVAVLPGPVVAAATRDYNAIEDSVLNVAAGSGLIPASDRATASIASSTPPAHGTVTVNPDGSFVYRPAANYYGLDQFSFRLTDGNFYSNEAVARITIANVPEKPSIGNFKSSNGSIQFEIVGAKDDRFEIQASADLSQPIWQSLTNLVLGDVPTPFKDSFGAGVRFYRAVSKE